METNIIQIGNSKGVIIPSGMLRAVGLSTKSPINIYIHQGSIVIKPHARQGWAAAAKKEHEDGEDTLIASDVLTDDIGEDIAW